MCGAIWSILICRYDYNVLGNVAGKQTIALILLQPLTHNIVPGKKLPSPANMNAAGVMGSNGGYQESPDDNSYQQTAKPYPVQHMPKIVPVNGEPTRSMNSITV